MKPKRGTPGPLSSEQFFNILRRRNRQNADEIDRRIESRSLEELTLLMADSSGFTRKTHEHGILQFLAVMTQCYDRLLPIIARRGGVVLSHNADNIAAVFEAPKQAVRAAIEMQRRLRRRNEGLPEAEQFNICIGIHHGLLVRLKDNVFGAPVNVAAKIGEDLAGKDEILVTAEVAKRIRGLLRLEYARSTEVGGRSFELHRVFY